MKATRPGNWTTEDEELVRQCIRDGMTSRQVWQRHFPDRTTESLKRKMGNLRAAMGITVETNFSLSKHTPGPPKPLRLGVLKYTLDDCPRVSLAYACNWAKQARRGWHRPADDKQAWLEINAMRLFGEIPVPPFLPAGRPVPDDLPNWGAGAA